MALIVGDRWWRKHGVTAWAKVVEVGVPSIGPDARGVDQKITADVTNAETGEVMRMTAKLWRSNASSVGEDLRVRWSPKQDYFELYGPSTVPEDEWLRDQNTSAQNEVTTALPAEVLGGVQIVNASGADPAAVLQKLASIKQQGLISDDQFEQARAQLQGAAGSARVAGGDIQERLNQLQSLRNEGTVTDQEYDDERRRILDSL